MYAKVLAESLMHYRDCLLFLAISRKRLSQSLSLVDNSIIVLLFGCIVLLGLTEKPTKYMRGSRSYNSADDYVYIIQ